MLERRRSKDRMNPQVPFTNDLRHGYFYMKWLLGMGKVAIYDTCLQLLRFESDDMGDIRLHGRFSY